MYKLITYDKYIDNSFEMDIINKIIKIYEHKGKSDLYEKTKFTTLQKLMKSAKVHSVGSSNRIEGIYTTENRLRDIVLSNKEPITRDETEIAGYNKALELIHDNYNHMNVTPNVILQIHKILYQYSHKPFGGLLKNSDNFIEEIDEVGIKRVRFIPVKPHLVKEYLEDLCNEYNKMINSNIIDPLFIIPIFIFDFLCIHPFNDGNGRMSRLLTLLLLYKGGYNIGKYISIEKITEDTKESYYQTLKRSNEGWYSDDNDITPFMSYFLGVILHAYKLLDERYISKSTNNESSLNRVFNIISNSVHPVSKKETTELLPDLSVITIERKLNQLLKTKKIHKIGKGRATKYKSN